MLESIVPVSKRQWTGHIDVVQRPARLRGLMSRRHLATSRARWYSSFRRLLSIARAAQSRLIHVYTQPEPGVLLAG